VRSVSFSLTELLATNGSVPEGMLFVILKSYFDGGNQADSREYEVVSLAVMSGTKDEWKPFEKAWRKVLKKHKVKYLHTTDAFTGHGIYSEMCEQQREDLLSDCVTVAESHGARATIGNVPGRFGVSCFVVSFVLKDFVEHAKVHPEAPNNANEACFRQAIYDTLLWSEEQAHCDQCHCFFDQGEPFYGYLVNLLESKKASKQAFALQKVKHRSESDMRYVPALQLADLYAWGQSHRNSVQAPWLARLLETHFRWEWIDNSNLHQVDQPQQEAWRSWKIPKRAPTK
jgi:hypothetical protein